MGIFDKFKKKEKESEENLSLSTNLDIKKPEIPLVDTKSTSSETAPLSTNISDTEKIKIDLILSEINNLKMQMEMINERLKIIERKIDEKGTIKYV